MTATFTALLCLCELWGKEEGWGPLPSQVLLQRNPRPQDTPWGQDFWGRRDVLSPRSAPSAQGPRPGLELLCVAGDGSHRDSLPGLCWGTRDQVQAGESSTRPSASAQ